MAALVGTWTIDTARSDDSEKFLVDCGVPAEIAAKINPNNTVMKVEDVGDGKFRGTVTTPGLPEKSHIFKVGEESETETPIGQKIKAKIDDNGNGVFTDTITNEAGVSFISVRKVIGNECHTTTTVGDKSAKTIMTKS